MRICKVLLLFSLFIGFSSQANAYQPGDTNGDNFVNDFDLANVIFDFGGAPSGSHDQSDIAGPTGDIPDGVVNDFDLASVIFNFGKHYSSLLRAPDNLTGGFFDLTQQGNFIVRMNWRYSTLPDQGTFSVIQRSIGNNPFVDIGTVPVGVTTFDDPNVFFGVVTRYRVANMQGTSRSDYSAELRIQEEPDSDAPAVMPQNFSVASGYACNILQWAPVPTTVGLDINLYRTSEPSGNYSLIESHAKGLNLEDKGYYCDRTASVGQRYSYVVTFSKLGFLGKVATAPSPLVPAIRTGLPDNSGGGTQPALYPYSYGDGPGKGEVIDVKGDRLLSAYHPFPTGLPGNSVLELFNVQDFLNPRSVSKLALPKEAVFNIKFVADDIALKASIVDIQTVPNGSPIMVSRLSSVRFATSGEITQTTVLDLPSGTARIAQVEPYNGKVYVVVAANSSSELSRLYVFSQAPNFLLERTVDLFAFNGSGQPAPIFIPSATGLYVHDPARARIYSLDPQTLRLSSNFTPGISGSYTTAYAIGTYAGKPFLFIPTVAVSPGGSVYRYITSLAVGENSNPRNLHNHAESIESLAWYKGLLFFRENGPANGRYFDVTTPYLNTADSGGVSPIYPLCIDNIAPRTQKFAINEKGVFWSSGCMKLEVAPWSER